MSAMRPYIVRQGEYLAKIAFEQGFDADEVWKHEKNKELRESGRMPEILCPGDVLHVPTKRGRSASVDLEAANPFRGDVPPVKVELVFCITGKPISDEPFVASGAGYEECGKTDQEGRARLSVPVSTRTIHLVFTQRFLCFEVAVGNLDPLEERTGQWQRLSNLGYITEVPEADSGGLLSKELLRRAAIFDFQRAERVAVTTDLDEDTAKALAASHRC